MDRRKLANSRPLHSNLSSLLQLSSQTSFKRLNSASSLNSQASVTSSRKRKNEEEDLADENNDRNKRKKNLSHLEINTGSNRNVRGTRGDFIAEDEADDTLSSQFVRKKQKKASVISEDDSDSDSERRESNESETSKRVSTSPKINTPSKTAKSVLQKMSQSPKKLSLSINKPRSLTLNESNSNESSDEDLFAETSSVRKERAALESAKSPMSISSKLKSKVKSPVKKSLQVNKVAEKEKKGKRRERPDKNHGNVDENNQRNQMLEKFVQFLQDCGIILSFDDEPHSIMKEPTSVRELMSDKLNSDESKCKEIIDGWKYYIEDNEKLKKALNHLAEENEEMITIKCSLLRLLLQVLPLQSDLMESVVDKITDVILSRDASNEATQSWVFLVLQQFRFLGEIQNPSALTRHIDELLEIGPEWLQREFISYLPDIVTDSQHHAVADILCNLMEDSKNSKITHIILDSVSNLAISKEYMEELRLKVLNKLQNFVDLNEVPGIVRFLTSGIESADVCQKVLNAICNINMECHMNHEHEECQTSQVLTVKALKMSLLRPKEMIAAAVSIVNNKPESSKPFHFIITLLVVNSKSPKAKKVPILLKQHIRSGYYSINLLNNLYNYYKELLKELQEDALQCASNLLKLNDRTVVDFTIEWFRLMFISQDDSVYKQREVTEKVLLVMGHDNQAAKNALQLLSKMMAKPEELKYLQNHCHFLRILLEKVYDLGLEDVATLNDLLHGLCAKSVEAHDILNEDMSIILQKQLSSPNVIYKCRGVLSAVMSLKNYAEKEENREFSIKLFQQLVASVEKYPKSKCLFYDQMGQVVKEAQHLDRQFLEYITQYFMDTFTDTYVVLQTSAGDYFEAKYNLNKKTVNEGEEEEEEEEEYCVQFPDCLEGTAVPILFRTLQICTQKCSESGDLEDINALLGYAILMPKNLYETDAKVLNFMFHCVNWFREIISAFVTQKIPLLRKQVIQRLEDLMNLQAELFMQLSICDFKYQPPPCYFLQQPIPPFVKSEKKVTRKGKKNNATKTTNMTEDEAWNKGSEIYAKNPMYFRRLDTKIALLLDLKMDFGPSQPSCETVSVTQVCFIVNELLLMFESETSTTFVKELIQILPKICAKLQNLISEVRSKKERTDSQAVKLLLRLLTMIFTWKEFQSANHAKLLRDGLRCLACMRHESNITRVSCQELVREAYNYFEAQMDIVDSTQISLAVAFINLCQALMSLSRTFNKATKSKQADMAFGFLMLDWPEDKHSGSSYRHAIAALLKNWIDNEIDPLERISTMVKNLPEETKSLKRSEDCLNSLPSITKNSFSLLLKKIYEGIIKGVNVSLNTANSDPERIKMWKTIVEAMHQTIEICRTLETKANILLFMRYVPQVIRNFLSKGMPILEYNLKYQTEDVRYILRLLQECTKFMHNICTSGVQKKDVAITKLAPLEKQLSEQLLFRVKGMCVLNNSKEAFWMGNLQNKNLQGQEIDSQTSNDQDSSSMISMNEERSEVEDDELSMDEADDDLSEDSSKDVDNE